MLLYFHVGVRQGWVTSFRDWRRMGVVKSIIISIVEIVILRKTYLLIPGKKHVVPVPSYKSLSFNDKELEGETLAKDPDS